MRLYELFEDFSSTDLKRVEFALDKFVYQPEDKIKKRSPVIDLELPSGNAHFIDRLNQRAKKANIDLAQIYNLLKRAKTDPTLGLADKIDSKSKEENASGDLVIQDEDNLRIPVVFDTNRKCEITAPGNPVCVTRDGKFEPRNQMVAKTIYRKGVPD